MLELWGGHECTVNRVGDRYRDQTVRSGHQDRPEDLDRFAELGLKALRYPVLWERVAPDEPGRFDWRWTDARLPRIAELGMRPIAGLLHHGSGPAYTSLVDEAFPRLFAAYARAAAERYAWIDAWTPINEPLTTARFSAQYGHWYPHQRDEAAFWRALLSQIEGTHLAMREIRAVNPSARLVQTEDLGRTYGRGAVDQQVAFDNARRWMTWDLLTGRVTPGHPLWLRLVSFGFEPVLRRLADEPCPPDVIGINHYLTSDRFLDDQVLAYPPDRRGGNGRIAYADVEAIRVAVPPPGGLEGVLREAWARYGLPIAVTESHNGCTREEQVRWLREGWQVAQDLRADGVDVRAFTPWALLGSHDWSTLLLWEGHRYEAGAFDVRGGQARPTALAAEIRRLAGSGGVAHPATLGAGWWRRDVRLKHRPVTPDAGTVAAARRWRAPDASGPPLLITGATGTLGQALARGCELRGLPYVLTDRARLAIDEPGAIARALDDLSPWAVVNAAGWVRVDDAESDAEGCYAANTRGAALLAEACAGRGLPFATFSSDLVFGGDKAAPYVEDDPVAPANVYGASKAAVEEAVLRAGGRPLVIRTSAFFSPHDPYNFADWIRRELTAGREIEAAEDLIISPTYVPDLVHATLDLLIDGETGLRHLANGGACSWAEFGRRIAEALGLDAGLVKARPAGSFGWPAPRPAMCVLGSRHGSLLPSLEDAIGRYADAIGRTTPVTQARTA
jgi:dTDP-4-dehydrorhamnose reductase